MTLRTWRLPHRRLPCRQRKEILMTRRLQWLVPCCLFIAFASPIGAGAPASPGPPTVTLDAGKLAGMHFGPAENEVAFLGVPYAAPPVGDLRWRPPQAVPAWTDTRAATRYGASCPQPALPWLPDLGWSEDCLFLNVWTTHFAKDAKRAVVVYFHGGGNKAGRSEHNPVGPSLARTGLVVVTANYRLGPLGFLAHPALTAESDHHASGNYGLLDHLQALRWVRDNISRFGGDPAQVTVMGQSAVAYDVCVLMASPMAAGLVQRAILQSGDCPGTLVADIRTPLAYSSITGSGETEGARFLSDLGIEEGPGYLTRLRAAPVDQILQAWQRNPVDFGVVVDRWVLREQPARVFADGRQIKIPVLVGSNADEATVFRQRAQTIEQFKKYLVADTGKYADREFHAYPVVSDAEAPARFLELANDVFLYGANSLARAVTRAGQPAYQYYFAYKERPQFGAFHGSELLFLSNSFPVDWPRNADGYVLGEGMRSYWSQFAKADNPNAPGLPVWPAYDPRVDQVLELGSPTKVPSMPPATPLKAYADIMHDILRETMTENGR